MADLVIEKVRIVQSYTQANGSVAAALNPATLVDFDATGQLAEATAGEIVGLTIDPTNREGQATTYVQHALLDVGDALDALAFGDPVFQSASNPELLADSGTIVVGVVEPVFNGPTADKLLHFDIRHLVGT